MLNLLSVNVLFSVLAIALASNTKITSTTSAVSSATTTGIIGEPVLSAIWTEGLIICLLVSLLLIGILVIAIQWTSSITISYGALEKPNNPSKKIQ